MGEFKTRQSLSKFLIQLTRVAVANRNRAIGYVN